MDMTGSQMIPAPPARVWEALRDPEILRQAVPGCETMERTSPVAYTATLKAKVGPVEARFSGHLTLESEDPPHRYTLKGKGSGGVAGFASGSAVVTLTQTPDGEGTCLAYTVSGMVGGRLAQIGGRLLDSAAKSLADIFFTRFSAALAKNTPNPTPKEAA